MGGPDDGGVEGPVCGGAVSARPDAFLHRLALLQDLRPLGLRGPAAGQGGGLGLKHGPQLEEIPQLALHPLQAGEAEVVNLLHPFGHKGALAPAHLQHPLGGQGADGLPQGGPAHPQG